MKTCKVIPIFLAFTLAAVTSAAAQHSQSTGHDGQHMDEHGPSGLFEELHLWGYSEDVLTAVHEHMEAIHQSIEEILGLHDPEGPARDAEDLHRAGESSLMRFHDAYGSVVLELEEEHANAFTAMLFEHLFHSMAPHEHGGEGHQESGSQHGHG